MLAFDEDNDDIDVTRAHEWNIAQLIFASFGTCALYAFTKIPVMQYYGSGWSIVMFVAYLFILAPIMYLQLRLGSQYRRSLISLLGKFWPFGKGVAIAFLIRNMFTIIMHSVILMLAISYIAFSLYRCDRRICIDDLYMWSSCLDPWSSVQCSSETRVTVGPAPEDDFFNRFVYGQIDAFSYMELIGQGGFPSWWIIYAVNNVFLLIAWIILWLCTMFGARAFGYLLYGIGPLAFCGLLAIIGWAYAAIAPSNQTAQQQIFSTFYSQFSTTAVTASAYDSYTWQPLEYGFLGMLVQMCFSLQLWSGQYTTMGKYVGYGRRTMQSIWVIPLVAFGLLGALPTVAMCAMLAYAYDPNYMRKHIALGYPAPFIIFARAFSKSGVSAAIAVVFFLTVFLFTLISISMLILTCTDNIIDSLRKTSPIVERNVTVSRRVCTSIICLTLYLCSILLITKAGIFWVFLIDSFVDRFMCVLIPFCAAGLLLSYCRSTNSGSRRNLLIVAFIFAIVCCTAAYVWYLVTQSYDSNTPSYNGYTIPTRFIIIGWLIAACPVVLGLSLGFILALCESGGSSGDRCKRVCCGSQPNDMPYFPRGEESDTEESKRF